MTRPVEVEEKVGMWARAYETIKSDLTPTLLRDLNSTLMEAVKATDSAEDPMTYLSRVNAAVNISRVVFANDRAAATVAAMLVATGIKPVALEFGE